MNLRNFYSSLFTYQKKYPALLATVIVSNFLISVSHSIFPLIVKMLLDFLSGVSRFQHSWVIFSFLVVNYGVLVVASTSQKYCASQLCSNVIEELRFRILKKIQSVKPNSGEKIEEGRVLTTFTSCMISLENVMIFQMWKYSGLIIIVLVSAATLVYLEWHLSLVVFLCIALMYKIPEYFSHKAELYLVKKEESDWVLIEAINEEIALRKVIRIFLLAEYRQQLFKKMLQLANKMNTLYGINFAMISNSAFLSTDFVRVLILIIGAFLIESHHLTLIELTGFYLALVNLSGAISDLSNTHSDISQGAGNFRQIDEFLGKPEVVEKSNQQIMLPPFANSIVFKDVSFRYKDKYALSNINLEIQAGQFVAFVGPSGAGKSTLLNLLLDNHKASQGEILVDGISWEDIYMPSIFKQIGVLCQDTLLFNMSIADNIRMGKQAATNDEIIAAAKQTELHEFISKLPSGYDSLVGKQNESLSGGQCQRIAIARALISNPAILYLDEATSFLDPFNCDAIDKTLEKMAGTRTIISVTHRLRSAVKADQIFVLDQGEIVERGRHQELLAKHGLYSQLWEKQNGVLLSEDKTNGTVNPLWFKFVPLFADLSPSVLAHIGTEFDVETVEENETIFEEGDIGNKFYIIAAGAVEVTNKVSKDEPLAMLSVGDFFGEIALLSNTPRNATTKTKSVCIFMTLTANRFHKIIMDLPENTRKTLFQKAAERAS